MATEIRMPALGQVSDELLIVRWLKHEGDSVKLGEPLLEVETDKATLEVEAAAAGTLLHIARREGETIQAGTVIAYVGRAGENVPGMELAVGAQRAASRPSTPVAVPGTPPGKVLATPVARHLARQHGLDITQVRGSGPGGLIETRDVRALVEQKTAAAGVRISPVARQMAEQHHIDLSGLRGSGPNGRIEKKDVENLLQQQTPATAAVKSGDIPVPRQRQVIAQRLEQSARTIPQIRLTLTANVERARNLLNAQRAAGLDGLTYTHLILRATAQALRTYPALNRVWISDGPRYRPFTRADVGLAIAGEDNLLVATIPEPDHLSLTGLVRHVGEAVERGRRGTLSQADTNPAAITVSNLGMYGVDEFQALVDPGQTAILAVGRAADQVVVIDGGIRVAPLMHLSLTVDHRVADGALAAQFLRTLRDALEHAEV